TLPEDSRIHERRSCRCDICVEGQGTRFILPWATDANSEFRRRTNVPAFDVSAISPLVTAMEQTVPTAMLFLRKIRTVYIRKNSVEVRAIRREDDGNDTLIGDGRNVETWYVLRGDFNAKAEGLRLQYPSRLNKSADVAIAVPYDHGLEGRLCAYLPTEE